MEKSAHAHSLLIQNRQFRARITRKDCGYFNEAGRNSVLCIQGKKRDSSPGHMTRTENANSLNKSLSLMMHTFFFYDTRVISDISLLQYVNFTELRQSRQFYPISVIR